MFDVSASTSLLNTEMRREEFSCESYIFGLQVVSFMCLVLLVSHANSHVHVLVVHGRTPEGSLLWSLLLTRTSESASISHEAYRRIASHSAVHQEPLARFEKSRLIHLPLTVFSTSNTVVPRHVLGLWFCEPSPSY